MKILVFGGTGAMGIHLVEMLKEHHSITVTSRSKKEDSDSVKYVQGNIHDICFFRSIVEVKWDIIIDFMVYSTTEFQDRVDLLLDSTDQYVFLSSSRVYSNLDKVITESTPRLLDCITDEDYLETDEYALTKARQENILIKHKKNNWTIIRPYITYNENRLQLGILEKEEWLYRAIKGRSIVFSRDILKSTTTLTYGYDVANGIKSILGDNRALGLILHITHSQSITWERVLDIYLKVLTEYLGYKPKVVLLDLDDFIKIAPRKYQIIYDRLYDRIFDNSNILQFTSDIDWISPEKGIEQCLKSFLQNIQFINVNWGQEAIKDKFSNEFVSLKEYKEILGVKAKLKYLIKRFK